MRIFSVSALAVACWLTGGDIGKAGVVWNEAGECLPADMMTWEELKELRACGWEIGSHAHSHVQLDLRREIEQERLISRSVAEIENNLGVVPLSFAYPYGLFSDKTKEISRRSGLRYAVTTVSPSPSDCESQDDLLELRRVSIGGRRFYHYFKAFFRTISATGMGSFLIWYFGTEGAEPIERKSSV